MRDGQVGRVRRGSGLGKIVVVDLEEVGRRAQLDGAEIMFAVAIVVRRERVEPAEAWSSSARRSGAMLETPGVSRTVPRMPCCGGSSNSGGGFSRCWCGRSFVVLPVGCRPFRPVGRIQCLQHTAGRHGRLRAFIAGMLLTARTAGLFTRPNPAGWTTFKGRQANGFTRAETLNNLQ